MIIPEFSTSDLKIELWFLGRRKTGADKPTTLEVRAILFGTSLWDIEESNRLRVVERYAIAYSELQAGRFSFLGAIFLCFKSFERLQYTSLLSRGYAPLSSSMVALRCPASSAGGQRLIHSWTYRPCPNLTGLESIWIPYGLLVCSRLSCDEYFS